MGFSFKGSGEYEHFECQLASVKSLRMRSQGWALPLRDECLLIWKGSSPAKMEFET
jgi:hypothetical protein